MPIRQKCLVCASNKFEEIHHRDIEKSIVEGELHFFFSVDMREFLSNPATMPDGDITKQEFEKLQGSKKFANQLRKMEASWEKDDKANKLRVNGFNNGVFGGVLTQSWLDFPTYRVIDDEGEWFLRCSWLGLFEVHLKKSLNKADNYDFIKVIEEILKYRTKFDDGSTNNDNIDENDIWYKVFNKINTFCGEVSNFDYENIKFRKITLSNHISFTQRQRYGIVVANNITCSKCKKRLPAEVLSKNTLLPSLIYSSLVSDLVPEKKLDEKSEEAKIPDMCIDEVENLSTWNDEICSFSSERGFIYYNPNVKVEENEDSYDYGDYWNYIMRGVQHTVTIRAALQSLQTQIKKLTDKLPELIAAIDEDRALKEQESNSSKNNSEIKNRDENLASSLANILQTMPQLSNICIPSVAFKAKYAVDKFKYLNEKCFGFNDLLNALRRDTRDVSTFLEFYKQYQLQIGLMERREIDAERLQRDKEQDQRDKEQDRKREDFGLFIAVAAILFIAPTAIKDGAVFLSVLFNYGEKVERPFVLVSLGFFLVIVVFLIQFRRKQEENRQSIFGLDKSNISEEQSRHKTTTTNN